MEKIFNTIEKVSRWVLIIGCFVYAAYFAFYNSVTVGNNPLMIIAHLVILFTGTVILVAVPVLLLLKKEEAAKIVFFLLAAYWVISAATRFLGQYPMFVDEDFPPMFIVCGVFSFLIGLGIVGFLTLLVLSFALKKDLFKHISFLILLSVIALLLIAFVLFVIAYATTNFVIAWYDYVNLVGIFLFEAPLVFIGLIYFLGVPKKSA